MFEQFVDDQESDDEEPDAFEEIAGLCSVEATPQDSGQPDYPSNEQLIGRLGSNVYATRQQAFNELSRRGLCALPDLLVAQNSSDPEVRRRAGTLIDNLGHEAVPYLVSAAESDDRQISRSANSALSRLSMETLLNYGESEPEIARRVVAQQPQMRQQIEALREGERIIGVPYQLGALNRSLSAAHLVDDQQGVFHNSLTLAGLHLSERREAEGMRALENCIQTVERNRNTFTCLHAWDFIRQVNDMLDDARLELTPEVRAQMERMQNRMRMSIRQNANDSEEPSNGGEMP